MLSVAVVRTTSTSISSIGDHFLHSILGLCGLSIQGILFEVTIIGDLVKTEQMIHVCLTCEGKMGQRRVDLDELFRHADLDRFCFVSEVCK